MDKDKLAKTSKKAYKLREDFRKKFKEVATKFHEVCLEMEEILTEIVGDENAKD